MSRDTGWSWKVANEALNPGLNLRYEPGCWGDLLKHAWALRVANALLSAREGPLRLLDPYAGAPDYPLTAPAAARLRGLPLPLLCSRLPAYTAGERFPSTARLVIDRWREADRLAGAEVFDQDAARLAAWRESGLAEALALESGEEGFRPDSAADLFLLDPYDLFDRSEPVLPRALEASRGGVLLCYLFNKSPRAVKSWRRYQDLRSRLERLRASDGRSLLVARVASDALLPRAYHEVWLLAPAELLDPLQGDLVDLSERLCEHVARLGCWEREG